CTSWAGRKLYSADSRWLSKEIPMAQYQYYPQPYDGPEPGYDSLPRPEDRETLGSWILAVFLTLIPLVNIIYLLVVAFGTNTSVAKRSFARASLIWLAVGTVVSIVVIILVAVAGLSVFAELLQMI